MTSRMEVLDLIDASLTERLGRAKVTRRQDGVIIVAGDSEAFAIQALTIDAPDEANPMAFGEELIEFIRSRSTKHLSAGHDHGSSSASTAEVTAEGTKFYTSENGDAWSLVTDVGGRRFVRHTPTHRSGGQVSVTDLEAFRQRDPHSPQNARLEALLARRGGDGNDS